MRSLAIWLLLLGVGTVVMSGPFLFIAVMAASFGGSWDFLWTWQIWLYAVPPFILAVGFCVVGFRLYRDSRAKIR